MLAIKHRISSAVETKSFGSGLQKYAKSRLFCACTSTNNNSNNNAPQVQTITSNNSPILHKGYINSKFSYFRGWAYQQVFLNRRINYKRSNINKLDEIDRNNIVNSPRSENDHDRDRILFFEHQHVYTLGRGADENHVAFLDEQGKHLLSRKYSSSKNSDGTSRLYVDKFKSRQFTDNQEESMETLVQIEVDSMGKNFTLYSV